MGFLAAMEWGMELVDGYAINVWNCRAMLSRWEGHRLVAATNWEEIEDDAVQAVESLGGAVNMSGIYPCPVELAMKGVWEEQR
jgi:hypothetical protein